MLAQSLTLLIACRVVLGLGEGLGENEEEMKQPKQMRRRILRLGVNVALFAGLPVIFHLFAHNVPVEERSRAFGYLVAAGSVGQVVASVVRFIIFSVYTTSKWKITVYKLLLLLDMSTLGMADWILFIRNNRYRMDSVLADAVSGD